MANNNTSISYYQPCWECGELAGADKKDVHYGNFKYGIEHQYCGKRIQSIIGRTLLSLAALNNGEPLPESVLQSLIEKTSEKLNFSILQNVKKDKIIQRIVETDGVQAANLKFQELFSLNHEEWQNRLNKQAEILSKPLDKNSKYLLEELLFGGMTTRFLEQAKFKIALKLMTIQFKIYLKQRQEKETPPYCIIHEAFYLLKEASSSDDEFVNVIKNINKNENMNVVFLGWEKRDSTYIYINHVIIDQIAFVPCGVSLLDVQQFWKLECEYQEGCQPSALPIDCLDWKNHWVAFSKNGHRFSFGETGLARPDNF